MKLALVAINAKYIHSNLAVRYLKQTVKRTAWDVVIVERSINDHIENILRAIMRETPDVVAFSTYIWNVEIILKMAAAIKQIAPRIQIVLGGPEVSFTAKKILKENMAIDWVMCGEGELLMAELLKQIEYSEGKELKVGLLRRISANEVEGDDTYAIVEQLDEIPFPYTEGLTEYKNKIIYYESSRGCPYSCAYCLSSATRGVRYLPINRVLKELQVFVEGKVKQVKFVDRTFNSDPKRAKDILRYILALDTEVNFHFEICADLLDDETIDLLNQMPQGRVQIEAGIQTVERQVLERITRKNNHERIRENLKKLDKKNVHIHLDLIAGLPGETLASFGRAYNYVYSLNPDMLQLGFLKVLEGSKIAEKAKENGLKYHQIAPYEILETQTMPYTEMEQLKLLEEVHEQYVNSHRFKHVLIFLNQTFNEGMFELIWAITKYLDKQQYFDCMHSINQHYIYLADFARSVLTRKNYEVFLDVLKLDFILLGKPTKRPVIFETMTKEEQNEAYQGYKTLSMHYTEATGERMTAKKISKYTHLEKFKYNILDIIKGTAPKMNPEWVWVDYKKPSAPKIRVL